MPDPLSRALAPTFFRWDASMPSALAGAVSDMAQFGIVLAILVVGLAALWASRGSTVDRVVDTVLRLVPGVAAVVIAFAAAHVAGMLLSEARPFVMLAQQPLFAHAADNAFPSDHVTAGMSMIAARIGPRGRILTVIIVALVGVARIVAGVHWLDDIVGGAIIGLAVAWLVTIAWGFVPAGRSQVRPA
jgi:membrane-associated phospholipid phosphatase